MSKATKMTRSRRALARPRLLRVPSLALVALALAMAAPAFADAGTVSIYSLPNQFAGTHGVAAGPDGKVWFTEQNAGMVGNVTADGATFNEYPTTYGDTRYIAAGPDGNMWFTEYGGAGAIGRITPAGVLSEFPIPTPYNRPWSINKGSDGNMWFTEDGNKIGRITMAGQITEFPIPTSQALPDHIAAGPDGNMWFSESTKDKLATISPQGHIREFKLAPGSAPSGIVTGPDGNLWITEQSGPPGKIAKVDVSGGKLKLTEFTVDIAGSMPYNITNGPDGNLWFTEVGSDFQVGRIGRITTAGAITLFDSQASRNKSLIDITAGPGDGKVWYGLYWTSQIASMTTA